MLATSSGETYGGGIAQTKASDALSDRIREANRGRDILFVPDPDALEARLAREKPRG
ncbi:MAG TPA: hypothetical protein VGM70_09040 [Pseudolysinimonas sp.]|jgi:hypothetical protein